MKIKRILCAMLLVFAVAVAHAQGARAPAGPDVSNLSEAQIKGMQVPEALYRLAAIYKQKGDLTRMTWALRQLNALLPNAGELKLALASVYAAQGDKTSTYDLLLQMQRQGYGYDLTTNATFAKVNDTRAWNYIAENLKANLKQFGEGKVAYTLPKGDYLFESLAFDAKKKQLLVGSVREGKIYRVGKDGKLEDFIAPSAENSLWSVYAMAVDPAGENLYVASTSSVYFKGFKQQDYGKAGVFKFRLSDGKLINKYLLTPDNQPRTLSSIAVGKNGEVFAADGVRNLIYRLDGGALKLMVENPKLTSVRGLAVSGDGKTLYFADYSMGLFGVDLSAGKAFDIDYSPETLVLGGIDGVYWYDGTLVVIENGMSPRRIMRLTLDKDGRKIVKAMPLDVANTAFGLPTYGAVDGDSLYFVANSQKNDYDAYGVVKDDSKLESTRIFKSNLRFAWNENGVGTQIMPIPTAGEVKQRMSMPSTAPKSGLFKNVEGGAQSTNPSEAKPSGS
jgi:sugar lactone lactonase YvrE